MKLSTLLIMLLMVGSVIVGTYTFINELSADTAYNVDVDQQYLNSFNKTTEISNNINESYRDLQAITYKSDSVFQIITAVPDVLSIAANMIKLPFTIIGDLTNTFQEYLGLPTWVAIFIIAVITVMLIFAVISLILRYNA